MPTPMRCPTGRVGVVLVTGGRWHDTDFARRELLALLGHHDAVQCTVRDDFADVDAIGTADAVIAYTCDVRPTPEQARALRAMVADGGRLLALHATTSAIDAPAPGAERIFRTPDAMPELTGLVGHRFLAHPRIGPVRIEVRDPDHPLVAGIGAFTTTDEIYVAEVADDLEVILDTDFDGPCPGFETDRGTGRLPVLFTRREGAGAVTMLTLGHCRGRFDVRDLGIEDTGVLDRVAWESSEYREVLRRSICWAVHGELKECA